jgi:hypothetical protein
MRIDLYTKTILTLIALTLAFIACKPLTQPAVVSAQSPLAGVQFTSFPNGGFLAFDTKSGDIWVYPTTANGQSLAHLKLTLGKDLVEAK